MKDKLSILVFPDEDYPPKRAPISELFMKKMSERGHNIHYVLFSENVKNPKKIKKGNNTFHLLPYNPSIISPAISKRFKKGNLKKVSKKTIENNSIDMIHVRDNILSAKIGLKLSKKHDIPFAYQLTSLFFDFYRNELKNKKSIKNFLNYLRGIYEKRMFLKIIKNTDLFLPITKAMEDYYEDLIPSKPTLPLPLHAPQNFLNYRPKVTEYDTKPLIYIGQISHMRRLDFLIDVFKKVQKKHNKTELWFVGPFVSPGVKKDLKKQTDRLSLNRKVKFFDEVPKKEVPNFIDRSYLGLSALPPTLSFKVSSPTKAIEYLSVGTPAVVNREIEDQRTVVEESSGGYAVEYDVNSFSEKIIELLEDPQKRESMGRKGRGWIKNNRNYEDLAKQLERKYYEMIRKDSK